MGKNRVLGVVSVSLPTAYDRVQKRQYTGHTEVAARLISELLLED